jgi:hypothetical protein
MSGALAGFIGLARRMVVATRRISRRAAPTGAVGSVRLAMRSWRSLSAASLEAASWALN